MPVYPVRDSAGFVSGIFSRPYIVKNSGTNPVYLGQDTSLTVGSRAFSLPVGSTLNWSGTTELYAITDPGLTSELELLFTGENSFTPGPGTVIARLQNVPTLILEQPISLPGAAGYYAFGITPPTFNIDEYASILFEITNAGALTTNLLTDWMQLIAVQFNAAGGVASNYAKHPQYFISGGDVQTLQMPVKRDSLFAQLDINRAVGAAETLIVKVYGSYENISECRYESNPYTAADGTLYGGLASLTVTTFPTTTTALIRSINGPINHFMLRTTTGNTFEGRVSALQNGVLIPILGDQLATGAGLPFTSSLQGIAPMRPLQLYNRQATAASTVINSVTQ